MGRKPNATKGLRGGMAKLKQLLEETDGSSVPKDAVAKVIAEAEEQEKAKHREYHKNWKSRESKAAV